MGVVNTARLRQHLSHHWQDDEEEEQAERKKEQQEDEEEGEEDDRDTWVFPLVQMKPLGINMDEQVTQVSWHGRLKGRVGGLGGRGMSRVRYLTSPTTFLISKSGHIEC